MIKENVRKHEIISYILFTFIFSWAIWSLSFLLKNTGLIISVGAYMPGIMAIFLTGVLYKRKGIKELFKRLFIKFNPVYLIFVLFYWALTFYLSYLFAKILGQHIKLQILSPYYILRAFIFTLLLGGPLGEEIGWRGFLLPRLLKKFKPLNACLLVALIWASWHLPLFFIKGSSQYGFPFILFFAEITCNSLLSTWVFLRTKGNLLLQILYHTAYNIVGLFLYGFDEYINFNSLFF